MEEKPAVLFCSDKVGLLLRPFRALARGAVKKATNSQKVCGSEEGPRWPHTGRI